MSAIAGVFSRRGAPRRPGEIDEMLAVMANRGPDGTGRWSGDGITLGHGALHATPESVGEQMPLVDPLTGNVIVADVRLDNRPELFAQLGLEGREPSQIGDGRLLLDAYRTWGEDCVDHLLGDFAFAVWDERRRQLFLARDHFGAKSLTYHSSEGLFTFASDSRAVVGLEDLPKAINRDRVFDFLVDLTELSDTTSTFFEHVHRLPAAHTLTVTADEQRLRRYWRLPDSDTLHLGSDAEYEQALREILDRAVSCRLRSRNDTGVMLSGGIDSASVAETATHHGHLHTYSAISLSSSCTETALIRQLTSSLPVTALEADPSAARTTCGDFTTAVRGMESPFENGALLRTMFATAAVDARRSLLTGVYGDEVVGISTSVAIRVLLAAGRFSEVVRLVMADGNIRSTTGRKGLARQALVGLVDSSGFMNDRLAKRRHTSWTAWKQCRIEELHLRLDSEERERVDHRLDAAVWGPRRGDGPASVRRRMFDDGFAAAALERYDRTAAMSSIEARSPFMDRRLVEFCLTLPAQQFVSGGWTKSVLRRSMVDRLPTDVLWNRKKPDLGWSFTTKWLDIDPEEFLRSLSIGHPLADFADIPNLVVPSVERPDVRIARLYPYLRLALWLENWRAA